MLLDDATNDLKANGLAKLSDDIFNYLSEINEKYKLDVAIDRFYTIYFP